MKIAKEKIVTFVGDKDFRAPDNTPDTNLENVIRTELQFAINDLMKDGKHIFLTGIEPGFDMLAAEVVLNCAKLHQSIELYAVIPFVGHELSRSDADKMQYKWIYEAATEHIYINEEYREDAYAQRTDFLLANSSEVIVYDGGFDPKIKEIANLAGDNAWNMYDMLDEYFAIQSPVKKFLQDYPVVPSFRYGRDGVVFEGNNQPFLVTFEQLTKIVREGDSLHFFLIDGLIISASLTSNDCRVISNRYTSY